MLSFFKKKIKPENRAKPENRPGSLEGKILETLNI